MGKTYLQINKWHKYKNVIKLKKVTAMRKVMLRTQHESKSISEQ